MSKFQYIKHKDINFELWDECINNSKNAVIYACSWYLDIVSPGWDAILFEEEHRYKIVFPVTHFKKFGLRYLKQPDFTNELGLFGDDRLISENDVVEIFNILSSKFWFISSYIFNCANSRLFDEGNFKFKAQQIVYFKLPIDKCPDKIISEFDRYTRKNIRQALRSNLLVKCESNIEALISIFKENTAKKIYGGVSEKQYQKLRSIFSAGKNKGVAFTYMVKNSDRGIGGVLLLKFKDSVYYLFSSINDEGRQRNANSLLIYHMLEENHRSYSWIDFGAAGSKGVEKYKERFATEKLICYQISYNNLPTIFNFFREIRMQVILNILRIKKTLVDGGN